MKISNSQRFKQLSLLILLLSCFNISSALSISKIEIGNDTYTFKYGSDNLLNTILIKENGQWHGCKQISYSGASCKVVDWVGYDSNNNTFTNKSSVTDIDYNPTEKFITSHESILGIDGSVMLEFNNKWTNDGATFNNEPLYSCKNSKKGVTKIKYDEGTDVSISYSEVPSFDTSIGCIDYISFITDYLLKVAISEENPFSMFWPGAQFSYSPASFIPSKVTIKEDGKESYFVIDPILPAKDKIVMEVKYVKDGKAQYHKPITVYFED